MMSKVENLISMFGVFCLCILIAIVALLSTGKDLGASSNSAAASTTTVAGSKVKEMNNFRAVFVTAPSTEVAKKIAHGLVSNKLAACVNIIPGLTSVYVWEGKVNEDSESLLMIKTQSDQFDKLEKFVKENHPYDTPEIISVPIEQGSEKYLQWIKDTIAGTGTS